MRWLITGGHGMLGTELATLLRDETVAAPGRSELDVLDVRAVAAAVRDHKPDVVVNCAGWTAVDAAETHEEEACAVNGHAVDVLAATCVAHRAKLIQISTDYVFDGTSREPYREDDQAGPINAYGRSKLVGERAALGRGQYVVRTAWLYGSHGSRPPKSFVHAMIRLAAERETVTVVSDQFGQPTWTADLATQLVRLARGTAPPGVYHGTNSGRTSWYGFAREIFTALGADPDRVEPVPATEYPRPARRPANSVFGHEAWPRAGIAPMRDWREAFHQALPSMIGPTR
jgi:dTDP-4-dehydrorhamnose reductase